MRSFLRIVEGLAGAPVMFLATVVAAACSRPTSSSDAAPVGASGAVQAAASASVAPAVANASAHAAPTPVETTPTNAAKLGTLAPNTGIAVGAKVPLVHAQDLQGHDVSLAALLPKGPLLLAFYRGGWCPYCNFEIRAMTQGFPEYQKRGVMPVAVSVDRIEEASRTNAVYQIPFPVLSDPELSFIRGFRVENHVDDALLTKMKSFGVDLEGYSGKAHHVVAIPALFLIDRQGVVRWAHDDPTYTIRPTTAQILSAIDATHLSRQ